MQAALLSLLSDFANDLQAGGSSEKAELVYRHLLQAEPSRPELHKNLADSFLKREQPSRAVPFYRAALSIPNYARAQINLGNALKKLEDLDGAIECYRAALRSDPAAHEVGLNLAEALHRAEHYEGALVEMNVCVTKFPTRADVHAMLGYTLMTVGRFDAAERSFRRAIEFTGLGVKIGKPLFGQNDEREVSRYEIVYQLAATCCDGKPHDEIHH